MNNHHGEVVVYSRHCDQLFDSTISFSQAFNVLRLEGLFSNTNKSENFDLLHIKSLCAVTKANGVTVHFYAPILWQKFSPNTKDFYVTQARRPFVSNNWSSSKRTNFRSSQAFEGSYKHACLDALKYLGADPDEEKETGAVAKKSQKIDDDVSEKWTPQFKFNKILQCVVQRRCR